MLDEIFAEVNNYFLKSNNDIYFGDFAIVGGELPLDFLREGQYFRIVGSTLNDGVYKYPSEELKDESFSGAIWAMSVPSAFIALAEEIEEFRESEGGKPSAFVSESFGGYTYQRATKDGTPISWQKLFASRLNRFRRMNIL